MKRIKECFSTPRRAVITSVCILAILAMVGTGTVLAAGAVAEHSSIGRGAAENYAFADAGIAPEDAAAIQTEFDFENGQFIYEVEFVADGKKYDYHIKASDGTVIKKEIEEPEEQALTSQPVDQPAELIGIDAAKERALEDAGLSAHDVTYTKEKLESDDGVSAYDIEFYTDSTKYDYEINAVNGTKLDKSVEILQTGTAGRPAASTQPQQPAQTPAQDQQGHRLTLEEAKDKALEDAGLSSSDVTYTKEKLERDDGVYVYELEFYTDDAEYDYDINAQTGVIMDKSVEYFENNPPATTQKPDDYIGVDQAKAIAVNHAGFAISDITFIKAKLENDDGRVVYEIEFYKGATEYEYAIDAFTGDILEFDAETDD